jgi:bis(5'-nucleosidyl)-tetraphosphatase
MRRVSQNAAGVVVYRSAGGERTYLLLRSALTRRPIWEFPKGGVEAGETDAMAAEREMQEETGLREGEYVMRDGFREEERYVFTQGGGMARALIVKRVVYFLAEALTDRIEISYEAEEHRWVSLADGLKLLRFPGKRDVLQRADAFIDALATA